MNVPSLCVYGCVCVCCAFMQYCLIKEKKGKVKTGAAFPGPVCTQDAGFNRV